MKKASFVLLVVFFLGSCVSTPIDISQPQPAFDRPNSVVLDAWTSLSRRYNDYVKVYNLTTHKSLTFNIFAYDANNGKWLIIGEAELRRINDSDTVDSLYNGKLRQFRWFALQSMDGIDFTAQVLIENDDVNISIFE